MPRATWRRVFAGIAGLVLLAFFLPLVLNINRFHRQIRQTLQREFGRPVSMGSMTLRLIPPLGVDADYVTIEEDPVFGAEPFIRAEKLSCDVNPWLLWRGRVEFSQLTFSRPSINIVKSSDGLWNLAAFLERASSGRPALPSPSGTAQVSFSSLVLEDARINFKVREEKKIYGLVDTDLRLDRAAPGRWKLKLEGTPFRSDRALMEAGTLHLEGELGPVTGGYRELPLQMDLRVEKAQLADLLVLFLGRESGVLGRVEGQAHFAGTAGELHLEGRSRVWDIHGWDMLAPPASPVWQLRYRLTIESDTGTVRVDELEGQTTASRFRAAGTLFPWTTPRQWELRFVPVELTLPDLWAVYAAFAKGADPSARVEGTAGGALTWTGPDHSLVGTLAWQDLEFRAKNLPGAFAIARFRTDFSRHYASLKTLSLVFRPSRGARETMEFSASWKRRLRPSAFHLHLASASLRLERLTALARALGWGLLANAEARGALAFAVDYRGTLGERTKFRRQGWAELRAVELTSPRLNSPITIAQARVEFAGPRINISPLTANVAGAIVSGRLAVATEPALSSEFALQASALDADDLDQLLNPRRRTGSPLRVPIPIPGRAAEAAGLGEPDFFSRLRARGQLNVERLRVGSVVLENLRAEVNYNARHARFTKLHFDLLAGRFAGEAQLDFVRPPGYRLVGQLDRVNLAQLFQALGQQPARYTGLLSARGELETTGADKRELVGNITGRGAFVVEDGKLTHFNLLAALSHAAGLALASSEPDMDLHSLSGEFFVAGRRVRLGHGVMVVPGASGTMEGTADLDGRLSLVLRLEPLPVSGPPRATAWPAEIFEQRYRLVGTLAEPEVRPAGAIGPVR